MKPSNEFCIAFLKASGWLDNHDKQIRTEAIDECTNALYEVTPQTVDQKLDMTFVNALKRLKED